MTRINYLSLVSGKFFSWILTGLPFVFIQWKYKVSDINIRGIDHEYSVNQFIYYLPACRIAVD